jgi:hypothetical protein
MISIKKINIILSLLAVTSCSSGVTKKIKKTHNSKVCLELKRLISNTGINFNEFVNTQTLTQKKIFKHRSQFTEYYTKESYKFLKLFKNASVKMCARNSDYFIGQFHDHPFKNYRENKKSDLYYYIYTQDGKRVESLKVEQTNILINLFTELSYHPSIIFKNNLKDIDIKKLDTVSLEITYPKTSGKTKYDARKIRKNHLQESLINIISALYRLPSTHLDLQEFLDDNFPGQYSRAKFMGIKSKIKNKLSTFQLTRKQKDSAPIYEIVNNLAMDHWYYSSGTTRANVPDKQSNLQGLLKNREMREELLGFIILAESKIVLKKKNKNAVNVSVKVDFARILRNYSFGKISDNMEN